MNIRLKGILEPILLCSMLLGFGLMSVNMAYAGSTEVLPGSRAANLQSCVVVDTDDMRRNHMEFLLHKRDLTMREGIRTHGDDVVSLSGCISCHAAKDDKGQYIPVNEEEQFCQTCHQRVAVKPDCFDCHRTTPETN